MIIIIIIALYQKRKGNYYAYMVNENLIKAIFNTIIVRVLLTSHVKPDTSAKEPVMFQENLSRF